ncbi:Succinate dehydrogenase (quinone) protein [Dioscorea alata]|uniref:Succinate dehydrogenase (Quinone) protein n=2 Tax=Dioscorea alata TaxID=55571 RepID=A0ACB7VK37_DIOAL|nr:Succinate dehydrogenase (quinone) protein [Dioscorea alata]KAH7674438.1 Succinate dehydrogenase (quinone) protein [Dioscorea alata]
MKNIHNHLQLGKSRSCTTMAIPFSKTSLFSRFSSRLQKADPFHLPRRGYHIDLGAREKALLEEDPALKKFKSYKNTVKRVSRIGDVLTILVVAACSYEFYAVAVLKSEQREQN